jgi:hypothetical protein
MEDRARVWILGSEGNRASASVCEGLSTALSVVPRPWSNGLPVATRRRPPPDRRPGAPAYQSGGGARMDVAGLAVDRCRGATYG